MKTQVISVLARLGQGVRRGLVGINSSKKQPGELNSESKVLGLVQP